MRPLAMVAAPKIMAAFGLATEPLKRTEPSEPDTTVVNAPLDRKSTRLNSSHSQISYAVFCLKKKPDLLVAVYLQPPADNEAIPGRHLYSIPAPRHTAESPRYSSRPGTSSTTTFVFGGRDLST